MEDLLDEKDFTQTEKIPTPYRYYGLFMAIVFVKMIFYYTFLYFIRHVGDDILNISISIFEMALPLIMVLIMFLRKKQFVLLDIRQVILGIFLLSVYFTMSVFMRVLNPATNSINEGQYFIGLIYITIYYIVQFILCLIVMIGVKKYLALSFR